MDKTIEDKKAWVRELLIGCPFDEPLPDCPGCELRKLPIEKRIKAADEMTEKDLDNVINHHKCCLRKREGK